MPDRTRPMDFEVYSVTEVDGLRHAGRDASSEFLPFYAAPTRTDRRASAALLHGPPRAAASVARGSGATGPRSSYVGSEVFLSLVDPAEAPYRSDLRQLAVDALCTNRDLPLLMPVGAGKTDFTLESGAPVEAVRCVAGPTPRRTPSARTGDVAWRLISHLSLNYLSLTDTDGQGAAALREMLALYCRPGRAGSAQSRSRACARCASAADRAPRCRRPGPITFGRGLEVTRRRCDETAFEGTGVFLLGAVLEQFFAQVRLDQLVHRDGALHRQRGEIMRWPARGRRARSCERCSAAARAAAPLARSTSYQALRRDRECCYPRVAAHRASALRPARRAGALRPGPVAGLRADRRCTRSMRRDGGRPRAPGGELLRPARAATARCRSTSPSTRASACATPAIATLRASSTSSTTACSSLFYRAWAEASRRSASTGPSDDRFARLRRRAVRARRCPRCASATPFPTRQAVLRGRLARKTRNAEGLRAIVARVLPACRSRSSSSSAHWMTLPADERWRLGGGRDGDAAGRGDRRSARRGLGRASTSSASCSGRCAAPTIQRFLPGGETLARLQAWCATTSASSSTGTCG